MKRYSLEIVFFIDSSTLLKNPWEHPKKFEPTVTWNSPLSPSLPVFVNPTVAV